MMVREEEAGRKDFCGGISPQAGDGEKAIWREAASRTRKEGIGPPDQRLYMFTSGMTGSRSDVRTLGSTLWAGHPGPPWCSCGQPAEWRGNSFFRTMHTALHRIPSSPVRWVVVSGGEKADLGKM